VFALLVTSCQQVRKNLSKLSDLACCTIVLTNPLHAWYSKIVTTLACVDNLVTSLLYHGCNKLVSSLVARLIMPSSLLQVVNSLFQTCYNKLGTRSANITCWQLVNRLVTTCLQTCYNLCVFKRVRDCVRFGLSQVFWRAVTGEWKLSYMMKKDQYYTLVTADWPSSRWWRVKSI
jgi:hypothetical protein